jgi:hypothetical protein
MAAPIAAVIWDSWAILLTALPSWGAQHQLGMAGAYLLRDAKALARCPIALSRWGGLRWRKIAAEGRCGDGPFAVGSAPQRPGHAEFHPIRSRANRRCRSGGATEVMAVDCTRRVAQHQLVEQNVAVSTEGNVLNGGRHIGIFHDGRSEPLSQPTTDHRKYRRPLPLRPRQGTAGPGCDALPQGRSQGPRGRGLASFRTPLTEAAGSGGAKGLACGKPAPHLIPGPYATGTLRPPKYPAGCIKPR